jgi:haloalkane dehalogenase
MSLSTPSRPDGVVPALLPFASHWVEVDGHSVHYLDEGPRTGRVLLMLHSNPSWCFLYSGLIARLSADVRCVALDYPGFGLSRAADGYGFTLAEHSAVVRAVVEALDLQDVVLVAHDWGGPIGVGALASTGRLSGLVLADTKLFADRSLVARMFAGALGGRLGKRLIVDKNAYVQRMVPAAFASRKITADEQTMFGSPYPTPESRIPLWVSPRELKTGRPFLEHVASLVPSLAALPALILWATKDRAVRGRDLRRLQADLPQASVERLDGVGHYLWLEEPEAASTAIARWLVSG